MSESHDRQDAGLQSLRRPGSLLERTAKGTFWLVFWRFANRGIGIVSTLILVRLLTPADFGVVSIAMNFVTTLHTLGEFGIEGAIIRDDRPDRALYDTGFTILLVRGLAVAVFVLLVADPVGRFLGNPHFGAVAMAAAAFSAISAFENIGIVDFRRFMVFEKEFIFKLVPRLVSFTIGIILAFILRNFWALIIAIIASEIVSVALSYAMHPYRPKPTFAAWHRIASYSTYLWFANLVGIVQTTASYLLIGRLLGAGAVGVLGAGGEIAALPGNEVVLPMARVLFSGFAEIKNSKTDSGSMLLGLIGIVALVTFPAGLGLSLVADPVVRLAFGATWLQAIPVVQIGGVTQGIACLATISGTVFGVQGWMKAGFKLSLAVAIPQLVLLVVLMPRFGLIGAVLASAVPGTAAALVRIGVATHRLSIAPRTLVARIWRSILGSAIMAAVMVEAGLGWTGSAAPPAILGARLAESVSVGSAVYVASILALWLMSGRPDGPERDVLSMIRRVWQRRMR